MQVAKRDQWYSYHSRCNEPRIVVEPGEEFLVETELCSGSWLKSPQDLWNPEKSEGPNPCVCVGVKSAQPGMVLAVSILDIEVEDLGYTGFDGENHSLAHLIHRRQWDLHTKTVQIKDGFVNWSPHLKLPVQPMIGTLGTAPEFEVISNNSAGRHGGNMDVNEVTCKTKVYLPVSVEGALLHVGDVHAIQGDGEINGGGGIECRSKTRLVVDVLAKPKSMQWIRMETDTHLMTVACCRSVEESFYGAAEELLLWMVDDYGFTTPDAYLLMGQVLEARCTQFVNPTRSYICKIKKDYLKK